MKRNIDSHMKIKSTQTTLLVGFIFTCFIIYLIYNRVTLRIESLINLTNQINLENTVLYESRANYLNFEYNMNLIYELENRQTIVNQYNIAYLFSQINYGINLYNLERNRFDISNQLYDQNTIMTTLIVSGYGTYENILSFLAFLRQTTYLIITYNINIAYGSSGTYFTIILFIPNLL